MQCPSTIRGYSSRVGSGLEAGAMQPVHLCKHGQTLRSIPHKHNFNTKPLIIMALLPFAPGTMSPFNVLDEFFSSPVNLSAGGPISSTIPIDFVERENEYVMRCDVPGVHKKEIKISVHDDIVRIGHERHPDREKTDEQERGIFHRAERPSTFRGRSLRMPNDANLDSLKAVYNDGVLEIKIERRREERPRGRQIPIEGGDDMGQQEVAVEESREE